MTDRRSGDGHYGDGIAAAGAAAADGSAAPGQAGRPPRWRRDPSLAVIAGLADDVQISETEAGSPASR